MPIDIMDGFVATQPCYSLTYYMKSAGYVALMQCREEFDYKILDYRKIKTIWVVGLDDGKEWGTYSSLNVGTVCRSCSDEYWRMVPSRDAKHIAFVTYSTTNYEVFVRMSFLEVSPNGLQEIFPDPISFELQGGQKLPHLFWSEDSKSFYVTPFDVEEAVISVETGAVKIGPARCTDITTATSSGYNRQGFRAVPRDERYELSEITTTRPPDYLC